MAARLIRRASRLLAVPITFQPPIPSECTRLGQLAPSFPCQAPLHTSSLCHLAESLPEASQSPQEASPSPSTHDEEFYSVLKNAQGVEELLQIASNLKLNGNKGVMVIQQITRRENLKHEELLNDRRFQQLLGNVNSQIQYIWNGRLIRLLRSLYVLNLDSKNHYLQSVEIEVRWRLRKFSITSLALLADYIAPLPRSKDRRSLIDDVVKQVELRWTEIRDTWTLVTLICRLGYMSEPLMERLEDKVLEFAETFTPAESRRIIVALASQNRRSLPVLRALSYHLMQNKLEFSPTVMFRGSMTAWVGKTEMDLKDLPSLCTISPVQIGLVTFVGTPVEKGYTTRLNFCQPQVLLKLVTDIIPMLPKISPLDVIVFLRSLSGLRFSYPPLSEAVAQAVLERSKEFSPAQLGSVLLSFAKLNFQPSQSEEFFNMIHQNLLSEFDSLNWSQQIDTVWSLCVLGHATTPYFQKVLDPLFYNPILEKSSTTINHCSKLMHINTTAMLESPDHWGALLPDDVVQTLYNKNSNYTASALQKEIRDALRMVFPNPETCSYNVNTVYGWLLDGEVILDSEFKPLAVKNFVGPHNAQSGETEPLPEEARRFAILTREFSHYSFRGKDLLGRYAMCRRHLRAAGLLVVEIPFYEWQDLKSDWQKQCYLKDQFKKVVAEDMAQ
ncbi:PREDICTED: protein TBRG4 [Nanorana parkeri]|uniref:protein TBRG4 n=1 Tax=Nanorana parkeri TaxID=125878 RepID=UPI00085402C4|nr:PREDICTED: protein TBRG4 [Nanorana parkeri]